MREVRSIRTRIWNKGASCRVKRPDESVMEGLASLLIFAGLFYLMMRFGCGAHMVHGGHGKHREQGGHSGSDVTHVDPVCGMEVDPQEGYGKMYQRDLYRFCSRNCLDKFEDEPDKFLRKARAEEVGGES